MRNVHDALRKNPSDGRRANRSVTDKTLVELGTRLGGLSTILFNKPSACSVESRNGIRLRVWVGGWFVQVSSSCLWSRSGLLSICTLSVRSEARMMD